MRGWGWGGLIKGLGVISQAAGVRVGGSAPCCEGASSELLHLNPSLLIVFVLEEFPPRRNLTSK